MLHILHFVVFIGFFHWAVSKVQFWNSNTGLLLLCNYWKARWSWRSHKFNFEQSVSWWNMLFYAALLHSFSLASSVMFRYTQTCMRMQHEQKVTRTRMFFLIDIIKSLKVLLSLWMHLFHSVLQVHSHPIYVRLSCSWSNVFLTENTVNGNQKKSQGFPV